MAAQIEGVLSPWLHKQRIKMVRPYIKGKVLDYGCGIGGLAEVCSPDLYIGIDNDESSLKVARQRLPNFLFENEIPAGTRFDTIALLSVLEHITDPGHFLESLKPTLNINGRLVITTPRPSTKRLHSIGSMIGLFSRRANEQHQRLFDYDRLDAIAGDVGLTIKEYKTFLFGLNQLFILGKSEKSRDDR